MPHGSGATQGSISNGKVRISTFYYLNWIKKIRPYLTQESAKSVVHALVISKIDYCNSLFVNLPNKLLCRLQYILHCAARLITGTPQHEHNPILGRVALVASSQTNRIQSVTANIQCPLWTGSSVYSGHACSLCTFKNNKNKRTKTAAAP